MQNIEVDGFRRITKMAARKLWESDKFEFYVCPCKLRPGGFWHPEICVNEASKEPCASNFESLINATIAYNCTAETGKYLSFYIK